MPAHNDSNSTTPNYIQLAEDQRQSRASQVPQGIHTRDRDSSNQPSSRRPREGDVSPEERRLRGSNSDREAELSRPTPASTAPPLPDKQTSKPKERKDRQGRTGERRRPESSSSESTSGFVVIPDPPSRSSTTDESRPPVPENTKPKSTVRNELVVGARPPRSQQRPEPPNDGRPPTTSGGTQPAAQHTGQPPRGPADLVAGSKPSYAKVTVGEPAKSATRPPQSGAADHRSQPNAAPGEEAADMEVLFPGTLPEMGIDQQVQQIQQAGQVHQPQPHQEGEGREAQSNPGYGFGIGNVMRALTASGPSPPRDKTKEELQRALGELNHLRVEHRKVRDENRHFRHALHEIDHERTRLRDNNQSLQHELANVLRELEESKALSDTRGRELVGAQVFLTKADSLSISDVIDKVGVLNEEIFQAAASLSETLVHSKRDFPEEDMRQYCDRASRLISEPMVGLLLNQARQPEPEVNPLIVQAVLSIFLVGFCVSKLESWYPSDRDLAAFLGTLYNEIRTSEEQAVSGRWRALTRSRTRPTTEKWKAELFESLQCVLIVASWDSPTDHQSSFDQKLVPIFKAVEDLRIALGEKFTSADLEVNVIRAGSKFEPWMEDAYGDGRQSGEKRVSHEIVVGTTGIGLKKIVIPKGHQGPERFEPVLPPKVVLESTLREALDPPPPTKGRSLKKRRTEPDAGGKGGTQHGGNGGNQHEGNGGSRHGGSGGTQHGGGTQALI